jgi:hypothetical protein
MERSRESLRDFIARNATTSDAAPAVMRNLEPFYAHAEAGRYRLATGSGLGLEDIAGTISSATGRQAVSITLTLTSRLQHVTIADEALLWQGVMSDRGDTLGDCLREEHRTALQERLHRPDLQHVKLPQRLWERLEADLWRGLDEAVVSVFGGSAPKAVLQAIADSIRTAVYFFTGFAIAGDAPRMKQLARLVRLLPDVIPLHSGKWDSHRWQLLAH